MSSYVGLGEIPGYMNIEGGHCVLGRSPAARREVNLLGQQIGLVSMGQLGFLPGYN